MKLYFYFLSLMLFSLHTPVCAQKLSPQQHDFFLVLSSINHILAEGHYGVKNLLKEGAPNPNLDDITVKDDFEDHLLSYQCSETAYVLYYYLSNLGYDVKYAYGPSMADVWGDHFFLSVDLEGETYTVDFTPPFNSMMTPEKIKQVKHRNIQYKEAPYYKNSKLPVFLSGRKSIVPYAMHGSDVLGVAINRINNDGMDLRVRYKKISYSKKQIPVSTKNIEYKFDINNKALIYLMNAQEKGVRPHSSEEQIIAFMQAGIKSGALTVLKYTYDAKKKEVRDLIQGVDLPQGLPPQEVLEAAGRTALYTYHHYWK